MKKIYLDEDENTTSYRIRLHREDKGWKQKDLANRLHIAPSQISRWERGETSNISSSMLVSLAQTLEVSTDYLLCLTPVSEPKSYDISQLGLSEEAVRRLLTQRIDPSVLNRLLEHDDFPKLCALTKNYFDNTVANSIMAGNQLIDLVTEPVAELMSTEPSKRAEILKDLSFLKFSKLQSNEADIEKIKSILLKIIRDIKDDMVAQQPTGPLATTEAVKSILNTLPDKPLTKLTADDVSDATAAYIENVIPMDKNTSTLFKQLAKKILELPLKRKE